MFHDLLSFVSFYYVPRGGLPCLPGIFPPDLLQGPVTSDRVGHHASGIFLCALIVRYLSVLYLSYYHVR